MTAVMLILCLAQLGPLLVLLPAVAWLYWSGHNLAATALLIWTIPVGTIDNFLRPVLIKKGANLPLLLVFAGVLGGLASMGSLSVRQFSRSVTPCSGHGLAATDRELSRRSEELGRGLSPDGADTNVAECGFGSVGSNTERFGEIYLRPR